MMARQILIALGAGLATALLAAALLTGTPFAYSLFLLTPLPIALAGLGWGSATAAMAAVFSAVTLGIGSTPAVGVALLVTFAGPMAWLAHLAGLSRDGDDRPEEREWYPLGRILLHAVGLVAGGLIVIGLITGYDPAVVTERFAETIQAFLVESYGAANAPSPDETRQLAVLYVSLLPYSIAAANLLSLVFGLWLAGRITRASGRLARPWQPLWTVELPPLAALGFIAALAASLLPGGLGLLAAPATGAGGFAMVLLGLAVIHAITRGTASRTALITATYIVAVVVSIFLMVLAVIGLAEASFGIRRRFPGRPTV